MTNSKDSLIDKLQDADQQKQSQQVELKPCPFCGGEAELVETEITQGFSFYYCCADEHCQGCATPLDKSARRVEAATMWNTRAEQAEEKPVSVSLAKWSSAFDEVFANITEYSTTEDAAKAILHAAGVKYVD